MTRLLESRRRFGDLLRRFVSARPVVRGYGGSLAILMVIAAVASITGGPRHPAVAWGIVALIVLLGFTITAFELGGRWGRVRGGALRVYRRTDVVGLTGRILAVKRDVLISGLSLPTAQDFAEALGKRSEDLGVQVRLLVPDPVRSRFVGGLEDFLNDHGYLDQLSRFYSYFLGIWHRYPKLQIRAHDMLPTFSAVMFDRTHGHIEIYAHALNRQRRFVIELDFAEAASDYRDNLEQLWERAKGGVLDTEAAFAARLDALERLKTKCAR